MTFIRTLTTHSPAVTEGALQHFKPNLLSRRVRLLAESIGTVKDNALGNAKARKTAEAIVEGMFTTTVRRQMKAKYKADTNEEKTKGYDPVQIGYSKLADGTDVSQSSRKITRCL